MSIIDNINVIIDTANQKGCEVLREEPLKKYTTFKIGGNASAVITVNSTDVLSELYAMCGKLDVPSFVLGNGSNLLVNDEGYEGIVFRLDGEFRTITPQDARTVRCGAGVSLAKLCKYAVDHSLGGLEFAWGIPGSVGGAAFMNAGAYTGEMKDVIDSVTYVAPDGTFGTMTAAKLDLSYRHSVFADKPGIITSVTVRLKHDDRAAIQARMDDFLDRRRSKQPLEYPSAGSVFKRPKGKGLYAGALIQECGLKGRTVGGAQVSEKHSGFIINIGGATCDDVTKLIEIIQDTVEREKGVWLECEIKRIGKG
ncbi:MAG: UDP-N-acetylmuramate dehydrogenase [Clostridia bacterium]|nr:UDP-N-acetylmuramate dehydrogenase [Clostridia bacterium]